MKSNAIGSGDARPRATGGFQFATTVAEVGHKRWESSQPNSNFGAFQHNFQEGLEGFLPTDREECERGLDSSIRQSMESSDNSLVGFSGGCSNTGGRTQTDTGILANTGLQSAQCSSRDGIGSFAAHGHSDSRRGSEEEGPIADRMEFEEGGDVGASY